MSNGPASSLPDDLQRLLDAAGVEVRYLRVIDHGAQYRVTRDSESATLNVYNTGKISTGGKASGLRDMLESWRVSQRSPVDSSSTRSLTGTPRVGTDEAGKGDYFGPLVVSGVRVMSDKSARKLRDAGARDSKTLSVSKAISLAPRLVEAVGAENVRVEVLHPKTYEARRKACGNNVNKLLCEVNVQICRDLEEGVELVVVDEFGRGARSCIRPWLPAEVRLEVRPGAEDDVAVAAASVLARARYLEELEALSDEVGFELPRGATHVLEAARRVVEERGVEGLAQVAKVSFRTTTQVIGPTDLTS